MSPSQETPNMPQPAQNHPLILFPSMALHDALDSLAALMQCLCEIQQEHYGMHLMHRMMHDTLRHLAKQAQGHSPNA